MMITAAQKEQIYRDYHGKVYGYIRSRVNSVQDAEDLASDVFMKIFEKLESYDESKASLSTWIYTITRNTLTDFFRTRKVFDEMQELSEDDTSTEDAVCKAEMLGILTKALEALDERERDIVVFRYYFNKQLKDIAAKMGISYAYVRVLHNRALQNLRLFLENQ